MYALVRNSWKFVDRDKRINKVQNIEFDYLAPDTVEEIFKARRLLEIWTAQASLKSEKIKDENKLAELGRKILAGKDAEINTLEVLGQNLEKSNRKVVILKVFKAYHAYYDMLLYYAIKNLIEYLHQNKNANFTSMSNALHGSRVTNWVNFGGQLIPEKDADQLRTDIGSGKLTNWDKIHARYKQLWEEYQLNKQKHAYATLSEILGKGQLTQADWLAALDKGIKIQEFISDQVYQSRKKDFENPFRQATFRNAAEMQASIGTIEDNSFVHQIRSETENFKKLVTEIKKRS